MSTAQAHDDGGGASAFSDHRQSWRRPVVASAVLTAVGAGGAAGQRVVRVVNLSDGGVGMIAAAALGIGTEHHLELAGRPEGSGRVRIIFCRAGRRDFEIGAEYVRKG